MTRDGLVQSSDPTPANAVEGRVLRLARRVYGTTVRLEPVVHKGLDEVLGWRLVSGDVLVLLVRQRGAPEEALLAMELALQKLAPPRRRVRRA